MKRPMTTEKLFNKVRNILREKGILLDILDYGLATSNPVPVRTYEFDLKSNLAYGGNKGIYLDLWIEYCQDGEKERKELGIFKTLSTDNKAMHIMANLLADFIIEEYSYVNANLDDFTWEGADVHVIEESGEKSKWGYSCATMEAALKRKDELLKKCSVDVMGTGMALMEDTEAADSREEAGLPAQSEEMPEGALDFLGGME